MRDSESRCAALLLCAILLTSCGGSDPSSGNSSIISAPSGLNYPAPPPFTVNHTITPLTPGVTGQVSSYGISPTLPAGLVIDSSSGIISGTPSTVSPSATYTVTASNASGATTANVSIVVNDVAPSVTYASGNYVFTANVPTQTIVPAPSVPVITNWRVSPSLPPGLIFGTTDGSIHGIPTGALANTTFVVTATNSTGQSTSADLTISVAAAPLFDLGHAAPLVLLRTTATRVLSLDQIGHWILQDYATGTTLIRGDGACGLGIGEGCGAPYFQGGYYRPVDLIGNIIVDGAADASGQPTALEMRSASDGHLMAALGGPFSWYELSADGSYVCTGSSTAVIAWSTAGQALVSHSGDYSKALVFCAPGEILIALGASGANVIETLSVPDGAETVSPPFEGQFASWFEDGGGFLTQQGSVVRIYSTTSVQQDLVSVTSTASLGGEGNWFWTYDTSQAYTLNIYKVGASASPALSASHVTAIPSGQMLALISGQPNAEQISIVDLSGVTLTQSSSHSVPLPVATSYASIPGGAWLVGDDRGVIADGSSPARFFTQGMALSISGGSSYVSIATAAGKVFSFDSSTDALASTIDFASSQLSSSGSGTVLAAATDPASASADWSVNIYSLPSGGLSNTFSFGSATLLPMGLSLSGSGTVLAENFPPTATGCISQVLSIASDAPIWCDTTPTLPLLRLSPDGTLVATTLVSGASSPWSPGATTNLYKNGTLITAVQGAAVGWLDDSRLLTNTYQMAGNYVRYAGASIYDTSGRMVATTLLPEMHSIQILGPDSLYSPDRNIIASMSTGQITWASGNAATTAGVVSGSKVYFASGSLILAQPH